MKHNLLLYLGCQTDGEKERESVIRTMLASHANLVMFPIQDLLGHGADARMNTPGTTGENWQYRITKAQLDSINQKHFRVLNRPYARA